MERTRELIEDTIRRCFSENRVPSIDPQALARILAGEITSALTAAGLLATVTTSAAV